MTKLIPCSVSALVTAAALALAGLTGCASTSGASSSGEPVDISDARYKLVISGGRMDGRVVEFKKRGAGFMGCLVAGGSRLQNVTGLEMGTWVFSVRPKANNEYEGMYRNIMSDGSISEKEVVLFFDGKYMNWNLETATWERQSGSEQLSEEEKNRCFGR
jgi:hypothetical protein